MDESIIPVGHAVMHFPVGTRVAHKREGVGYVEDSGDGYTCDVRWLTPNNEPSVLTSLVWCDDLTPVPDSVLPMPRSKEWHAEARAFHAVMEAAVRDFIADDMPTQEQPNEQD